MVRLLALVVLVGVLSSPLWLAALILEDDPRFIEGASLSVDDVEDAKRLLRENNPRNLRSGERRRVELTQRQLNLMLRYALPAEAGGRVAMAPGMLTLAMSLPLPVKGQRTYFNSEMILLQQDSGEFSPLAVTLGPVRVPGWMAAGITRMAHSLLRSQVDEYAELMAALESLSVGDQRLTATYRWRPELLARLRDRGQDLFLPAEQRERILAYYGVLADLAPGLPRGSSLADALGPLFREARRRSGGGDPATENRAALIALAMAVQGVSPGQLDADNASARARAYLGLRLRGRRDLAQHFVVSAALTAGGGSQLADAVGVFKELSDAQGGSGFSFPDLLADRAGVVFAQAVTGPSAGSLQLTLAAGVTEAAIMPPINRLPEGLQNLEFRSRYEDLNTTAYARARDELERRIAMLDLYR